MELVNTARMDEEDVMDMNPLPSTISYVCLFCAITEIIALLACFLSFTVKCNFHKVYTEVLTASTLHGEKIAASARKVIKRPKIPCF